MSQWHDILSKQLTNNLTLASYQVSKKTLFICKFSRDTTPVHFTSQNKNLSLFSTICKKFSQLFKYSCNLFQVTNWSRGIFSGLKRQWKSSLPLLEVKSLTWKHHTQITTCYNYGRDEVKSLTWNHHAQITTCYS